MRHKISNEHVDIAINILLDYCEELNAKFSCIRLDSGECLIVATDRECADKFKAMSRALQEEARCFGDNVETTRFEPGGAE